MIQSKSVTNWWHFPVNQWIGESFQKISGRKIDRYDFVARSKSLDATLTQQAKLLSDDVSAFKREHIDDIVAYLQRASQTGEQGWLALVAPKLKQLVEQGKIDSSAASAGLRGA